MKYGIVFLVFLMLLSGCTGRMVEKEPEISDLETRDSQMAQASQATRHPTCAPGTELDLSTMDAHQAYSMLYDMMTYPESYLGVYVTMRGAFGVGYLTSTGTPDGQERMVFSCILQDETLHDTRGLEFVPDTPATYPQDYPERGRTITVAGSFDVYEQNGLTYCRLTGATWTQE